MKNILMFICLVTSCSLSFAQRTDQQIIADSVIGWEKIYNFKGKQYKPLTIEGLIYSSYKVALCDTFTRWIQKSYTPIGGWGTIKSNLTVSIKDGPRPISMGTISSTWDVAFDKSRKKLEKISETWTPIWIYTNDLPGNGPVYFLNTPKQYYFTRWKNDYDKIFTDPEVIDRVKKFGLHSGSTFSKYIVYFWGTYVSVILIPSDKLPMVPVTKGEFLDQCASALQRSYVKDKEEIIYQTQKDPQKRASDIKWLDENTHASRLKGLAMLKEKYKSRLNEPAVMRNFSGPDAITFKNNDDIFIEGAIGKNDGGYPVYKYETDVFENSKKDKPLWIAISWEPQIETGPVKRYEIHRSMINHFNYEYVYDYFFNPEKVKGKFYRPMNEESLKATLDKYNKKEYTKTPALKLPVGVHFMDDFSTNAEGSVPAGWFSSDGGNKGSSMVTTVKEFPGKWVQLGKNNTITPSTSLKLPLPENFALEFDVATSEFSGRTGGNIEVELADKKNGTTIKFNLTPGDAQAFSSYASTAQLEFQLPREIKYYATYTSINFNDFSNENRKAHIAIKKTGRQFLIFINDQQIPYLDKYKKDNSQEYLLPAGTTFNSLKWWNRTREPNDKAYLGNIKITKN